MKTMLVTAFVVGLFASIGQTQAGESSCRVDIQAYGGVSTTACPEGFVDVNGKRVWIAKWCTADMLLRKRGIGTMVLNTETCEVSDLRNFDVFDSDDDAADLASYIDYLADGKVLIGVTADEPTRKLTNARRELRVAGLRVDDVKLRGSFAFVIQIGSPEKTAFAKEIDSAVNPNAKLSVTVKENVGQWVTITRN